MESLELGSFRNLDAKAREKYFLETIIGPRLQDIVLSKEDIWGAEVPIIRCTMESPLDASEEISIDVCCDITGLEKSLWLQKSFLRRPDMYVAFAILTRWARAAGLVKNGNINNNITDNGLDGGRRRWCARRLGRGVKQGCWRERRGERESE